MRVSRNLRALFALKLAMHANFRIRIHLAMSSNQHSYPHPSQMRSLSETDKSGAGTVPHKVISARNLRGDDCRSCTFIRREKVRNRTVVLLKSYLLSKNYIIDGNSPVK